MDHQKLNSNRNTHEPVCPYWLSWLLDNPLRKWMHDPLKILSGLIQEGETAVDLGCGPGVFSLEMGRMVGEKGHVLVVDLQQEMLELVRRKAEKESLQDRFSFCQASDNYIGFDEQANFMLTFWMLHEVENQAVFLQQVYDRLKPGGRYLLVEPILHVSGEAFQKSLDIAQKCGLSPIGTRKVSISRSVLFARK